jgi:hypothetical protein
MIFGSLSMCVLALAAGPEQDHSRVPGVVISHISADTRLYMPSPSIAILPNGNYVVSHDYGRFDRKPHDEVLVFGSSDKGRTWRRLSKTTGRWDTLFFHRGALYLFGCGGMFGNAVIRPSNDGGRTWTEPKDGKSGLLRSDAKYHTGAVPVVVHKGRIWRAFELAEGARDRWKAVVLSAPEDADLLDGGNWRRSEAYHHGWGDGCQWIEGNVVVAPGGGLMDILRTNGRGADKAAILHVSKDGNRLSHDPLKDVIDFPGGGSKLTIRFDRDSGRYWALAKKQTKPEAFRNMLVLTSSADLRNWRVERLVLTHPDEKKVGFHYADWQFDGDDIVAVSRTAFDDGAGGPHNAHDNNYVTFHRIENFRKTAGGVGASN